MPKREPGAVTIFCVIVLFSIVLLGGVFIDGSRVLLARQALRSSMLSAARSALSYYDTGMVGDFGLYGVTEETAKTQFERYLRSNLSLSQNDGFQLYRFTLGDTPAAVVVSDPLDREDVFVDQVSEYAKYRAGINLTIGVVEKVKMLFGDQGAGKELVGTVKNSKNAVKTLKQEANSFATRVDAKIKSALDTGAKKAKQTLRDSIQNGKALEYGEEALLACVTQAGGEISSMEQSKAAYEAKSEQVNQTLNAAQAAMGSTEVWNEETKTWETATANHQESTQAPALTNSPGQQAQALIDAAQAEVTAAQIRVSQNLSAIKTKAAQAQTLQTEIKQLEAELAELTAPQSALKEGRDSAQKALEDYQKAHHLDTALSLEEKQEDLRELQANPPTAGPAQEAIDVFTEEIKLIKARDEAKKNYESQFTQFLNKQTGLNKKKKALDTLLTEIDGLYDAMPSTAALPSDISVDWELSDEDQQESDREFSKFWKSFQNFYDKTIGELTKVDSTIGAGGNAPTLGEKNPGGLGFLNNIIDLGVGIANIFQNPNTLLECAYMVDYAMDKFTFLTSQSSRPAHHFQLGEVEYILKGGHMQGSNLGEVLFEIILIRVAINFVDDLIHTHSPEPISRILVALGRALIHTAEDMYDMLFREGCSLSPSFKNVKLTYSDHLRLKLLLNALGSNSRTEMKNRMVTMIDRTMDVKKASHTGQLYTRIDATAEARIDLIMVTLPLFGNLMPGQDVIRDGDFLLRETVSMGY